MWWMSERCRCMLVGVGVGVFSEAEVSLWRNSAHRTSTSLFTSCLSASLVEGTAYSYPSYPYPLSARLEIVSSSRRDTFQHHTFVAPQQHSNTAPQHHSTTTQHIFPSRISHQTLHTC
ncbi:hypothetical protein K504DRAFT_46851 [Pleomassaria siparia CBS 279.74]|uniref:Uncharacterized protein n=1 Tax=Pleomassaria siparia CBS 279.74 TaxID=1314801 RepID=A0A6G1K5W3_9PLEO|nr:hypothetical protein K504DRAFT_46851 [Pleomassaria siparia CBS 279.74]